MRAPVAHWCSLLFRGRFLLQQLYLSILQRHHQCRRGLHGWNLEQTTPKTTGHITPMVFHQSHARVCKFCGANIQGHTTDPPSTRRWHFCITDEIIHDRTETELYQLAINIENDHPTNLPPQRFREEPGEPDTVQ